MFWANTWRLFAPLTAASLLVSAALLGACDDGDEEVSGTQVPEGEAAEAPEENEAPAENETPVAEGRAQRPAAAPEGTLHQDLLATAHLADLETGAEEGLFVDFGTQSRFKYTSGNWNSGWGSDAVVDDESVSRFGRMGRIYLPIAERKELRIRLKVRGVGTEQLLVFMNGTDIGAQAVPRGQFTELMIDVPAEHVRPGENYLLLRSTETRRIEEEAVSFEVAWLQLLPATGEAPALPRPLRQRTDIAGTSRDALVLPAPGRLSWYLEVPEDGRLHLQGAALGGGVSLKITATPEGGEQTELHTGDLGAAPAAIEANLGSLAGKVVRLQLEATGSGRAALLAPQILTPAVEEPALGSSSAPHARNVIVLTVDTLRASKLRPYNRRSRVRTPAFDAFAAQSTLFERAQTPENWTKPSVASILTSLFPATHGAKNDASRLPQSVTTLAEIYQEADFETASFLANGYVSRAFGFDQGWDHYTNYIRERKNTNASNVFGEAADWIEEHKDEPFFVYIQTIDPHVPYDPPSDYLRMYDARGDYDGQVQNRRTHLLLEDAKRRPPRVTFSDSDVERLTALHDGEISYHDQHFGEFLEKLDEWGLDENTVVVVTSDHGEEFNEHGSWGHGHSIFQELLHVPLVVRYPGVGEARRVPQVVSTMGIAPTVLEATGIDVPDEFEGNSLMPFVRGNTAPGPWVAFSDFQENRRVIRGGDWKLVLRSSLTYVLFDLANDPRERNELNGREHPIAMRYLRILSGQNLGVSNRAGWLTGGGGGQSHESAETMNLELCQQLVALGYMDCLSQFPDAM